MKLSKEERKELNKHIHQTQKEKRIERMAKRRVLVQRKFKLLKKPPISQKKAFQIVKETCEIFGFHCKEERIFNPYIVDIYIKEIAVGIEMDGGIHDHQQGYDMRRDEYLYKTFNLRVFRFDNEEVRNINKFRIFIWDICMMGLLEKLSIIRSEALQGNYKFPIIY